jgi:predicted DNA-binding transcriptional regulator AlpA
MLTCAHARVIINLRLRKRHRKEVIKTVFDKRKFLAQMTLRDVSKKELAEKLGINEVTLYRKINNDGFFTRREINTIIEFLAIENPAEIFFANELAETKD